jgi:threonine dehydrogenase-like Zn-dependent dehydrogenase
MEAVVHHDERTASVEEVPDAGIEQPTDVVIGITTTNTRGSDVHRYEGRSPVGEATPSFVVSHELPPEQAPEGYAGFDAREDGWPKVLLRPGASA